MLRVNIKHSQVNGHGLRWRPNRVRQVGRVTAKAGMHPFMFGLLVRVKTRPVATIFAHHDANTWDGLRRAAKQKRGYYFDLSVMGQTRREKAWGQKAGNGHKKHLASTTKGRDGIGDRINAERLDSPERRATIWVKGTCDLLSAMGASKI